MPNKIINRNMESDVIFCLINSRFMFILKFINMNIAKPDCYYIKTKKYTKLYIINYNESLSLQFNILIHIFIFFLNNDDEILIFWTCFFFVNIYFYFHLLDPEINCVEEKNQTLVVEPDF